MSIESTHPQYQNMVVDWTMMRDLYLGERHVKEKGQSYLPATSGMFLDGMDDPKQLGYKNYCAYKMRAVFPDYVKDGVEALVGLICKKPAVIEVPKSMEPLTDSCTLNKESLQQVLRRIYEELLVTGRLGVLVDLPVNPDPANPLPYLALYIAESIKNWDDGSFTDGLTSLNMVVLDESGYSRTSEFEWQLKKKYRVLQLGDLTQNEAEGKAQYMNGVFLESAYLSTQMVVPMIRGVALEEIPFVFVNPKDITSLPDSPPLLGLGHLCLTIYRGEADYRQNLFMQGQDTLVVIGGTSYTSTDGGANDQPLRIGAGGRIDCDIQGDAKFIGVQSEGLTEQRSALENDRAQAETRAGKLVNAGEGQKESGDALTTRLSAQTATLYQISLSGAAGLEKALRFIAKWLGEDASKVKVTPNTEFADVMLDGKELVALMSARTMGAPISKKTIHNIMADKGLTDMDFEEELEQIEEEDAQHATLNAGLPSPGSLAEGGPNDPNALANKTKLGAK